MASAKAKPAAPLVQLTVPRPSDPSQPAAVVTEYARQIIINADNYVAAAAWAKEAKARRDQIEDQRKELVAPIDEARKRVQEMFVGPIRNYDQAIETVKRKLIAFDQEQERIRAENQRRADEAAEKERQQLAKRAAAAAEKGNLDKADELTTRAQMVVAPVIERPPEKIAGVARRKVPKFAVENAALVPEEYKIVDEARIGRMVRATQGQVKIPGVRVWLEDDMSVSGKL